MQDNKISAVLITYNEERNIAECLESIKWADEIVVIDANSQDRTVEFSRKFTDRIHRRSWPGFGPQKNFGIDQATSDWILIVDADERVTPELRSEIRQIVKQPGENIGFRIPRRNFYYGKWVRWGGLYPDYQLRLFKKSAGRYNDVAVHENLILNGPTGYLKNPLDHMTERRLSDHMKKFMLYTTLAAQERAKKGGEATYIDLAFNHEATFLKSYFIRRGFKDGVHGFVLGALAGMYTFVKYAKLWEDACVEGTRMRIGVDATPIFLRLGGIGYYILNVLKHLARIDHENEYRLYNAGRSGGGLQLPFQHAENFQIVNVWRPALRWSMKRDGIDVFHGTNYRLPARGLRGSIVSIYDLSVARFPQLFRKVIGRKRDFIKSKRIAQRADRVITISRHSAMDIADLYEVPSDKISTIYCGIGDEFFPEKDPAIIKKVRGQYGLENRDYILFVGGSDPRKNALTLLKAYGTLSEIHNRTVLVMVGSMQKRAEEIHKVIHEGDLEHQVMMVGDVTQDALRVLYSQAAVFVLPSLYEGFGMPVLEAMACGAPVITSDTSSIPEVAGDAAVLLNPTDMEALASSIRSVLKDQKTREAMRSKGFSRAKLFSWENAAKQTLEVYETFR